MSIKKGDAKGESDFLQLYLALIYVSKASGVFFLSPSNESDDKGDGIWRFLVSRLTFSTGDAKRSSELSILACNMLYQAFRQKADWPIEFVQAYLEDSFGPRFWVDDESARPFVRELLSVTPKDRASEQFLSEDDSGKTINASSASGGAFGTQFLTNNSSKSPSPPPTSLNDPSSSNFDTTYTGRFNDVTARERVSLYAVQIVEFHLATLGSTQQLFPAQTGSVSDSLKHLIRTMAFLMPYASVRVLAARHLDGWFSNTQTARPAKELFRRMVINTCEPIPSDIEVARLVLRFKNAQAAVPQLYYDMLSRLSSQLPIFRSTLLRDIVSDLLVVEANAPGPGAKTLGRIFEVTMGPHPDGIASLATVFHELALDTSFAPNLRLLAPMLLNYYPSNSGRPLDPTIVASALCETSEHLSKEYFAIGPLSVNAEDTSAKEIEISGRVLQWAHTIADAFASVLIYSVPKLLYDAAQNVGVGSNVVAEREESLKSFVSRATPVFARAVEWCCRIIAPLLHESSCHADLPPLLRKITLMDHISSYYLGNKPLTNEQLSTLAITLSSVPISDSTIFCICSSASSRIHASDALDLIESFILRAKRSPYASSIELLPRWHIENFVNPILQLSRPQSSTLPAEAMIAVEPTLAQWAQRARLWKAIGIISLASASIYSLGALIWDQLPTGYLMLEMILTNSWHSSSASNETPSLQESSKLGVIRESLSSIGFDDTSSEMDLIQFSPSISRIDPPASLIAVLKEWDAEFRLSRQLLGCRSPDFVGMLLSAQGLVASGWLAPLVAAEVSLVSSLPISCLVVLLLSSQLDFPTSNVPTIPSTTLVPTISETLAMSCASSMGNMCTTLQFFFTHVASPIASVRKAAHIALSRLAARFSPSQTSPAPSNHSTNFSIATWLQNMIYLPFYKTISDLIDEAILQALKTETNEKILEDLFSHVCARIGPSSNSSLSTMDLLSIVHVVASSISSSTAKCDTVNSSPKIRDSFASMVLPLLQLPSNDVGNIGNQSRRLTEGNASALVAWKTTSNSTPVFLPSVIFSAALAVLSRCRRHSNIILSTTASSQTHKDVAGPTDNLISALLASSGTEYPSGTPHSTIIELFRSLSSDATTELLERSAWANKLSGNPTSSATTRPSGTKRSKAELLASLVVSTEPKTTSTPQSAHNEAKMSIDSSIPSDSLEVLTLELLGCSFEPSEGLKAVNKLNIARIAAEGALAQAIEKNQLTLLPSISNFNQVCVHAASFAPTVQSKSDVQRAIRDVLGTWKKYLQSVANNPSVASETAFQLAQEISLLNPYELSDSNAQQALEAEKKSQLASFWPQSAVMDPNHSSFSSLMDHLEQKASNGTPADASYAVYWISKIAELDDFAALIPLAFASAPNNRVHKYSRVFMEVLHTDSSWSVKRKAIEFIVGSFSSSNSIPSRSSSDKTHFKASENSAEAVNGPISPKEISNLNVSVSLDFITQYLESPSKPSWSEHISSISNAASSSLSERQNTLLNLSKPQLLRTVDLVLRELTEEDRGDTLVSKEEGSKSRNADADEQWKNLVFKRSNLLLALCNVPNESKREEKLMWVIEYISQIPSAYSMNTMRWLDEMAQTNLSLAKASNFRPEHLIARTPNQSNVTSKGLSKTSDIDVQRTISPNSSKKTMDDACETLLTQLYFECPWQVFSVVKHFTHRVSATTNHSKLDYLIHKLLQKLGSSSSPSIIECALLALRTCAYSHPAFIIKFMPTMTALVNGKAQQGAEIFFAQNGPQVFDKILGVLEMLVPLVLHDNFAKRHLWSLLDEYFKMLATLLLGENGARQGTIHLIERTNNNKNANSMDEDAPVKSGGKSKIGNRPPADPRLSPLVSRLSYFLAAYCAEPLVLNEAIEYLSPHAETIEAMIEGFPDVGRTRSVMDSILNQKVTDPIEEPISSEELVNIRETLRSTNDLLKTMDSGTQSSSLGASKPNSSLLTYNTETLNLAQEALVRIEAAVSPSSAHCAILNYLIADILPFTLWSSNPSTNIEGSRYYRMGQHQHHHSHFMTTETASPFVARTIESVRRCALRLSLLFLRTFPRSSEKVVDTFIRCLASPNQDVRSDALPHARDAFICCIPARQQSDLMMTLFEMGKLGHTALRDILGFLADLV